MAGKKDRRASRQRVAFGQQSISFSLSFARRRTLKITVHPDQSVAVEAPAGRSVDEVRDKVERRAKWILRQMEHFRQFHPLPTPRRYVSGETHLYLGRQYRLKLIRDDAEQVKLIRGYFRVHTADTKDQDRIRVLLTRWFSAHGHRVIDERVSRCAKALKRFDVPNPTKIVHRRMRKRWGSCGKRNGTILLNRELAHVPLSCIDYVITHELCHLKHPNHSRQFHFLLSQCMPDWRKRKERLETVLL